MARKKRNSHVERTVTAFLESKEMDETRSYLARGRHLKDVPVETLHHVWAESFKALASDDHSRVLDLEDSGAELKLRGMDRPTHLVGAELEDVAARMRREGPTRNENVRQQLRDFIESMDDPKH